MKKLEGDGEKCMTGSQTTGTMTTEEQDRLRKMEDFHGTETIYLCQPGGRMRKFYQSSGEAFHQSAGFEQLHQQSGRGSGREAL